MKEVKDGHCLEPPPPDTAASKTFVPYGTRVPSAELGHNSWLACHPELGCTLEPINKTLWWPFMKKYMASFISTCSVLLTKWTSCFSCPFPIVSCPVCPLILSLGYHSPKAYASRPKMHLTYGQTLTHSIANESLSPDPSKLGQYCL